MKFRCYVVTHLRLDVYTYATLPKIDPANKGTTTDVTHECGAISRHRSPQFNTRLRLRRVTSVNFRSRPIYRVCTLLSPRVRIFNSRTAQFPNFSSRINDDNLCEFFFSTLSRSISFRSHISFGVTHRFTYISTKFAEHSKRSRFISILKYSRAIHERIPWE